MAAAGAGALAISLWLPWYSFHLPAAALDSAAQLAHQMGISDQLISRGTQLISQLGGLHVTAWQALTTLPAVLLVCAVVLLGR